MDKQAEFISILETKYPKLYKKKVWPEFDEGWYKLVEELSNEIYQKYNEWSNLTDVPFVEQMKEKFGGLRFYLGSDTFFMDYPEKYDEIDLIVRKYEKKSQETCEYCSAFGSVRRQRGMWLKCMCDDCERKYAVLR